MRSSSDDAWVRIENEQPQVVDLARLASIAVRVEPRLLRELRLRLLPHLDVGHEADLWFSSLVGSRDARFITIDPRVARALRAELGADETTLRSARNVVAAVHKGQPDSLEVEERLLYLIAAGASPDRIDKELEVALATIRDGGPRAEGLAHWALRALPQLHPPILRTPNGVTLAFAASALVGMEIITDTPDVEVPPEHIALAIPQDALPPPTTLAVELLDDGLRFEHPRADANLLELPGTRPLVLQVSWVEQGRQRSRFVTPAPGMEVDLGSSIDQVELATLNGRYRLSPDVAGLADPVGSVFLSAVSTEFATARNLIRTDLAAKGWEVREQAEFAQGGDATILERLNTYIDGCSTVVCIIGRRAGAVPPLKSALPFLAEHADILPDDFMPSYTQWELIFAHAKNKRLLIFHASDDFQPDQAEGVEDDDAELQAEFVEWIFDDLGLNRGNFSTNDELRLLVLREPWPTPTANGPKVRAEMTRIRSDEEAEPRIQLRAAHDRLAPSLSDGYVMRGRDRERRVLEAYLTRAEEPIIEIIGPEGVGKKKLLSQFEGAEAAITTDPEDLDLVEDLVQRAWERLVDSQLGTIVPRDHDRALDRVQALVFVADVESAHQLQVLRDAMPNARLCITATAPVAADADARRLELAPFGPGQERTMLEIFADRYLLPIPEELEPGIVEICRSVDGNPAAIVQQALAAERAPSLEDWIAEQRPLTTAELPADMRSGDAYPDPEAVADAVGEVVPRDVIKATTSPEAAGAAADAADVAAEAFERSLSVAEQRVAEDPSDAAAQRDLSLSLDNVGRVAEARGDLDTAASHYRRALTIRRQLVDTDPTNADWQRELSASRENVSRISRARGDS